MDAELLDVGKLVTLSLTAGQPLGADSEQVRVAVAASAEAADIAAAAEAAVAAAAAGGADDVLSMRVDVSSLDLSGADLSGASLEGASLEAPVVAAGAVVDTFPVGTAEAVQPGTIVYHSGFLIRVSGDHPTNADFAYYEDHVHAWTAVGRAGFFRKSECRVLL